MKLDYFEFKLAKHWACPLINGDYSGLENSEIKALSDFEQATLKDARKAAGADVVGHWSGFDYDDDAGFCHDEISGQFADCSRVRYYFSAGAQ